MYLLSKSCWVSKEKSNKGVIRLKKFVEITVQFKFIWSLFFAAAMLLYVTGSMIAGNTAMELWVVWQLVALTMLFTLYHYLFFGELILNSLGLKFKVLIHSILCYITLLLFCDLFNWIDLLNLKYFLIFTGSYLFLYLSCVFSFYIYYKATGEELNQRLTSYKQNRNIK